MIWGKESAVVVADKALAATLGEGADVVLDCVGQSFVNDSVKLLKPDGTWVIYGLLSE
jgi:NADPH:quinone reductase-like Zn-dependent oxidoreductase